MQYDGGVEAKGKKYPMCGLTDWMFRLRALLRRVVVEKELDEELRFHLEREAEKLMGSGRTRPEALRLAKLALGGVDQIKEECRQARGVVLLETIVQDLIYAVRGMRHNVAFTLTAVLTLGFGTAAVSTVLTVANTLFYRKLPVAQADQIVVVQATRRHGQMPGWVSYPDYVHFRDHTKTIESLAAAYSTAPFFVSSGGRAHEINGAVVSANFFPLLGLRPALGRFFSREEDAVPDRNRVAIISSTFWRAWFGSSPRVLGSMLKINGTIFSVIGVVPEPFKGVTVQPDEVYIPTMMARAGYRWCVDSLASDCTAFDMIGRLRDGYTVEQTRAEMLTLIPEAWHKAKEGENTGATAFLLKGVLHPDLTRASQLHFITLLTCVAGVLLIVCCVNLIGLVIARNSSRAREFALRASLGAGRTRLIRQLVTESVVIAASGGLVGTLLSTGLTAGLNVLFYSADVEGHPLYYNLNLDPRVVLAVLFVSVATGCLFGLIPALQCTYRDTAEKLKRQTAGISATSHSGRWLAGVQAGIAVALATIAGLLITSAHLITTGANFKTSHVALMRLRPRLINYPPEKAQRYLRNVLERLNATPDVEAASMAAPGAVLVGGAAQVSLPGWLDAQAITASYTEAGPQYFRALQIPVLRGREFNRHDTLYSLPVAIVSEALARQFWPGKAIIGSTVIVNQKPREVVGIVADIPLQSRSEPQQPYVYVPFWQNPAQLDARLCIRVKGDPAVMIPLLTRAVTSVDPDVPIAETIPLSVQIDGLISPLRITATFASYAAALALLLSGLGVYGALAFSVSRRTKEIGIRVAVGAKSTEVLAMVLCEGMTVVLFGTGIGIVLTPAATGVIRHLLYGPGSGDFRAYIAAALLLAGIGLFACWLPARRAASLDPVTALREE